QMRRDRGEHAEVRSFMRAARERQREPANARGFQAFSNQTSENADLQALRESPLTDSNRRPPPYHGTSQATGGNRSQRFSLVSAALVTPRFAHDCHRLQPRGSIKAPSTHGTAFELAHPRLKACLRLITAMNLCRSAC